MRMFTKLVLLATVLIVSVPLAAISADETGFTDAEFERHVAKLQTRLPEDEEFHVFIQKPFVVIGNDKPHRVKRWAEGTVKWSVDRLKKRYFTKDPNHIVNIWLFKDKRSYEKYCEEIVGYKPHTPFGFYSSTRRVLVMNISTGGGTLVHEIVHPFIESNFPKCPSWFNEGLASLYEQSMDKDGVIWGKTNWRLRGLHGAIDDDSLPSTKQLTATTTEEFYNGTRGDNYAQARYLCYYLQEKGLLQDYYRAFCKNVSDDPTGYKTLRKVLGNPDMGDFDKEWKKFCLGLRFP